MKVVLQKDVKGTGKAGQIVEVSDGYARNYLLPNKLAVIADKVAIQKVEQQNQAAQYHKEQEYLAAVELGKQINGITLNMTVKCGENGKVFGSITSKELAEQLAKQGFAIDKRKIELPNPIKNTGSYKITVKLHPKVTSTFMLQVQSE